MANPPQGSSANPAPPPNGTQIALIRGINVGSAKRVAMADLRELFNGLGYGEVRTLLNSGNVIFCTSGKVSGEVQARRIEDALVQHVGLSARVSVVSSAELAAAVVDNPLASIADDPSRLLVAFFSKPTDCKLLAPLTKQDWTPEALAVGARVAYLWCPQGILASRLAQAVSRLAGDRITTRNWATVTKLHALANDLGKKQGASQKGHRE